MNTRSKENTDIIHMKAVRRNVLGMNVLGLSHGYSVCNEKKPTEELGKLCHRAHSPCQKKKKMKLLMKLGANTVQLRSQSKQNVRRPAEQCGVVSAWDLPYPTQVTGPSTSLRTRAAEYPQRNDRMNTSDLRAGLLAACSSWLHIQTSYIKCLSSVDPEAIQKSGHLYSHFTNGIAEGSSSSDVLRST